MIRKRQLTINTLAAFTQVVITGVVFWILYAFVENEIGIERFGIWAIVLITATISSLANLGLGSSAVKFVSMYLARNDAARAALVAQTALITLAVVLLVVLGGLYPIATWALSIHPDLKASPALLAEAYAILPYAFVSFWVLSVAGVTLGTIDGHQRIDIRSGLQVCGTLAYLFVALAFVPRHGLLGLAWAHITQAVLLLGSSWAVAQRLLPALPPVPCRWRWEVLKEVLGYSLNFQVMSIFWLLFEPLTRWLVSIFGGLSAVGWFEFANRMVFQLRALIVSAHQSLVPTIADLLERQASLLKDVYSVSFRVILYLVLLAMPLFIAATPLISWLWHGYFEPVFITFSALLFVGWFLNLLSNPAYFAYMGIGTLRWNVAGRIVIGVLNGALGWLLGALVGGTGVIVGFVVALVVGSLVTTVAYQREYRIRLASLLDRQSIVLGSIGVVGLAIAWPILLIFGSSIWVALATPAALGLLVFLPAWLHPVRRRLQRWLLDLLPNT